jgi:glycine/sarcosine N-methyltransferase
MYDTFSVDYDRFVNWKNRLAVEMPFLERQLKEVGAKRVLDSACGTGMHAIALAQARFETTGADFSAGMVDQARVNANTAGIAVQFEVAGFGELEKTFGRESFDALLCLGNSLPHVSNKDHLISTLVDFAACLKPGGLLIVQNRNFDAVMEKKMRWMEPQAAREGGEEWIFLRFYDFEPDGMITFHILTLHRVGEAEWQQTIRSTPLYPRLKAQMKTALEMSGFGEIAYYGDMTGAPFDVGSSGNLVIQARRE